MMRHHWGNNHRKEQYREETDMYLKKDHLNRRAKKDGSQSLKMLCVFNSDVPPVYLNGSFGIVLKP